MAERALAEGVPLSALLPDRLDTLADRVKSRLSEDEQVGGMKLAWGFIGKELQAALKSVLDCDLFEILAKGWAQAEPLAAFADPAKHPPGERSVIELGKHDLSRELHPVIAVTIGNCPCVELNFTLKVTAKISGVRLSILDRHIVTADPGETWASALLSYEGTPLHDAPESRKIRIPGEIQFTPPGVEIPQLKVTA